MRADQPVVSAASWMVSASTRHNLIKVVSRFGTPAVAPRLPARRFAGAPPSRGGLLGRGQDALARLVALLVEADHRLDRVVGAAEPRDDVARLHLVVALPRGLDVDLGARRGRALALDRRLGLALCLAQARRLAAGRALGRLAGLAAGLAQAVGPVAIWRLALGGHGAAVGVAG